MIKQKYVPLHLHTEHSLLDGGIKVKELFQFAKKNNFPAVALTDHGMMYGALDFYLNSKNVEGVKPLIGYEFYICEGDIFEDKTTKKTMYHIVLIAKNNQGYQNLIKMASIAATDAFYNKPRINHEILKQYSKGLICLSACIQGEVAQYILNYGIKKATEKAAWYKDLFGDDYYIELQDHGLDEQKETNPKLIKIARKLDIELVISNDSHYLKAEDAGWHDTFLCEQTKSCKADANRFKFSNNEFYVKTVDELRKAFSWMDDKTFNRAIENTVKVADKCNVEFELGKFLLPNYPVPKGFTAETYFEHLAKQGLKERYGKITPEIEERYIFEKDIIFKMGFADYFLIIWDIINWAKQNKIPTGPGRGDTPGSIVAYTLGITDIDPIYHNLPFERFLNPERASIPDINTDICAYCRSEVVDYITQKYGAEHVCEIICFGAFGADTALKVVANAYEKYTVDASLREEARQIEGLKYTTGVHIAGVIISPKPLDTILPLTLSKEKSVISQFSMNNTEKLGLLKLDFVGIEILTVIQKTLDLIKLRHNVDIEINKIPLNDKKTFALFEKGQLEGVFQFEAKGMQTFTKKLKPAVFGDLAALVALFRASPVEAGMMDDFIDRKRGVQEINYLHPLLEPILKDTYSVIVYHEQIMFMAQVLADYSLSQADILCREIGKGKKDQEVVEKWRSSFIEGAKKNDILKKSAAKLFDTMMKFSAHTFPKSHSIAHTMLSYQSAYLKAHYPSEFMESFIEMRLKTLD